MNCKPPIFIIGNPRSGTTLLRLMLTCHPGIVIPPECGFAIWWKHKYGNIHEKDWQSSVVITQCLDDIFSSRKFEYWNLDKTKLVRFLSGNPVHNYSEMVAAIYTWFAKKTGKKAARWGDKNNFYLSHIPEIQELFPDALFIHIIRDPRDVVSSYKSLSEIHGKYAPNLPDTIAVAAAQWRENIQLIRESFLNVDRNNLLEIHFEKLIENTESTLKEVCSFLNETYEAKMLDYPHINKIFMLEPPDLLKWKPNTLVAPQTEAVGRFKKALAPLEINQIESITDELMRMYGYHS